MGRITIRRTVRVTIQRKVTLQQRVILQQRVPTVSPVVPLISPSHESQRALNYQQAVQTHNAKVRTTQQRINQALAKLQRLSTSSRQTEFRSSVDSLHTAYTRLKERSLREQLTAEQQLVLDLAERENANSLEVMDALLDDEAKDLEDSHDLGTTIIIDELRNISEDLHGRWDGALYALNPRNPDAARHFCTSTREIFTQILEVRAPDGQVLSIMPNCPKTEQGKPTRRAKIDFLLHRKAMMFEELEDFARQNIENILYLFRILNDGTHGSTGKFDLHKLFTIKKRAEDGIIFLSKIIS